MAYQGYFFKLKKTVDGKTTEWAIPLKYMKVESATFTPKIVQDLDPYTDADGLLHRNPVPHTSAKFEFSTPPMTIPQKEEFMSKLTSMFTDSLERKVTLQYYNDETGQYNQAECYCPDFSFTPRTNSINGIVYDPIRVCFIKY